MRPSKFLMAAFLFVATNLFSQTIYKVDSNPNAPTGDHVYSNLQDCIDAASDGDIIQIIPAVDHYGDVEINKELHLVGSGWVSDNQSGMISKVNSIVFESSTANGSTLNGLTLIADYSYPIVFGELNAPLDTLKDVEIYNCKIAGIRQLANCPIKNITLRNNVFALLYSNSGAGVTLNFQSTDGATENLLITNNIILRSRYTWGIAHPAMRVANQTIITNNLFISWQGLPTFSVVHHCFITNNVFYGAGTQSSSTSYANVFSNNLSYECASSCAIPPPSTAAPANTGSGNLPNTDPLYASIVATYTSYTNTNDLSVSEFSPLLDGGTDGSDIGIMGGQYPFVNYNNLRGVPYIHQMSVPGLIMENQDIQLEAEARNNQ
ncbi:MAG: hypothetical protein DRI54_00420 [Bacteroidetes bacterium]|nr:MAG: hypothetical protein DRI54_00420 [Bacteroidota bacterium]